jgi:PAS domain S-box-containing protein
VQQPEEKLHEQREWLRVTLSSIGDAVITTDTHGDVTFLNPVAENLTGWPLAEAIGQPLERIFQIINEESRDTVASPATRALHEGVIVGLANHSILISRDGSERPIDDSAAPIQNVNGDVAGAVLVFRDVTEQRHQERILRESEERFRLLVDSVKDYAIFMLDPTGRVVSWNAGAQHIKGYAADEIIGQHFSRFYTPEANATKFPQHELDTAKVVGKFEDEGWRVRKDGTLFWANVVITAVRDKSGKLIGFAKVTRDLTQRRELERAKAHSEALADINRRKDEFLAMLSHELRNPLAPISTTVQLLRLDVGDDPARQPAISILERQVAHLTRLVDDLLEVSRVSTGRIRLQPELIDLRRVAERAVEAVAVLTSQRQHRVQIDLPPEPVWLHADATRMEQIVVNLLTNATKYTNPDGEIRLTVEQAEEKAVLRVADTGVGIAPDLLPNIFDLFTQGERSLDRSEGGLGVGLTVVKRIVELHGGSVEALSKGPGQGSEFVVRLPLDGQAARAPASESDQVLRPAGRSLRVLVVDDNRDAANTIAMLLRKNNYHVEVAYSGESAIDAAISHRPDAVLLDIGLPKIDGYEVARRFRQNPDLKHARIVAVTGYGQDADQQRSHEAGFDAHMVKPVEAKKLYDYLLTVPKQEPSGDA